MQDVKSINLFVRCIEIYALQFSAIYTAYAKAK